MLDEEELVEEEQVAMEEEEEGVEEESILVQDKWLLFQLQTMMHCHKLETIENVERDNGRVLCDSARNLAISIFKSNLRKLYQNLNKGNQILFLVSVYQNLYRLFRR